MLSFPARLFLARPRLCAWRPFVAVGAALRRTSTSSLRRGGFCRAQGMKWALLFTLCVAAGAVGENPVRTVPLPDKIEQAPTAIDRGSGTGTWISEEQRFVLRVQVLDRIHGEYPTEPSALTSTADLEPGGPWENKSGSSGGDDDDDHRGELFATDSFAGAATLVVALLPGVALAVAAALSRFLRRSLHQHQLAVAPAALTQAMVVLGKALCWLFVLENLLTHPLSGWGGTALLLGGASVGVAAWMAVALTLRRPLLGTDDFRASVRSGASTLGGDKSVASTLGLGRFWSVGAALPLSAFVFAPAALNNSLCAVLDGTWYHLLLALAVLHLDLLAGLPWRRSVFTGLAGGLPNLFVLRVVLLAQLASDALVLAGAALLARSGTNTAGANVVFVVCAGASFLRAAVRVGWLVARHRELRLADAQATMAMIDPNGPRVRESRMTSVERPISGLFDQQAAQVQDNPLRASRREVELQLEVRASIMSADERGSELA